MIFPCFLNLKKSSEFNLSISDYLSEAFKFIRKRAHFIRSPQIYPKKSPFYPKPSENKFIRKSKTDIKNCQKIYPFLYPKRIKCRIKNNLSEIFAYLSEGFPVFIRKFIRKKTETQIRIWKWIKLRIMYIIEENYDTVLVSSHQWQDSWKTINNNSKIDLNHSSWNSLCTC